MLLASKHTLIVLALDTTLGLYLDLIVVYTGLTCVLGQRYKHMTAIATVVLAKDVLPSWYLLVIFCARITCD